MAQPGVADTASRARQAASAGEWSSAFELLMDLDAGGTLVPDDLPLLAEISYAAGHLDVTIAAWERVHRHCVAADDRTGAGGAAARVAMHLLFDTALMAPVRGWLRRAERHLAGEPESPAHAWHAVVCTYERMLSGDRLAARRWAELAVALGSAYEPAAGAIGRVAVARLLLLEGEVDPALALLDEVAVAVSGGDLEPLSTGVVYCELVCALQGAAQYDLAEQWTEVMERWCATNAIGSLHGRCRVHRAEILRLRGRFAEAEAEATAACDELRPYLRRELGWPLTELGQIRLRRGDEPGAGEALRAAYEAGWDPQPGLARLYLAQGNVAAASDSIREAIERPMAVPSKERPPDNDLRRAPVLSAQVEIELAAGDLDRARTAVKELERIAGRFKSQALVGDAELARGRLRLAEGDAGRAEQHLTAAARIWREIRAPYELAMTHAELAAAHRALGRQHQAELEEETGASLLARLRGTDRAGPVVATSAGDRANGESRLHREGEYWTISYGGETRRIRDLKGIHHLARLLGDPGREFHVLDLVTAEHPAPDVRGQAAPDRGGIAFDDAGEMLDDQARTAYRRRLTEIEEDIDDARSMGDVRRAEQAEAERDFLVRELSRAFGIGGRSRKARATSERARVAVTRAIRTALRHITEHHPALGQHLDHAVRTGTYCSYEPDPAHPVRWRL